MSLNKLDQIFRHATLPANQSEHVTTLVRRSE